MADLSKMSGCPWHVETLKKKDDRRHNHNCIYFKDSKCINIRSSYYDSRCGSSSHCKYYEEISAEEKIKKGVSKKENKDEDFYWLD